jgi:hypothetical protein
MAFLLVRISPISFHIRTPHDAIIRRISEAGSSHRIELEITGVPTVYQGFSRCQWLHEDWSSEPLVVLKRLWSPLMALAAGAVD